MTVPPRTEENAYDRRSLHERIAADLRDEIMTGDLAPGASLPSTVRLKERFGASNATVQKALQLLKSERLVVGRAGASVTVREHRQLTVRPASSMSPAATGDDPYPWLAETAKRGGEARSTLIAVTETAPPADVAAALRLPAAWARHSSDTKCLRSTGSPWSWSMPTTRRTSPVAPRWPNNAGSRAELPPC